MTGKELFQDTMNEIQTSDGEKPFTKKQLDRSWNSMTKREKAEWEKSALNFKR